MHPSDQVGYRSIADQYRSQILAGELAAGQRLPSEKSIAQAYGVNKNTAREAMNVLRGEGLIFSERGRPSRVREQVKRRPVRIPDGASWIVRMPTPDEVRDLLIPEGVPVVEITLVSEEVEILRGDQVKFVSGRPVAPGGR